MNNPSQFEGIPVVRLSQADIPLHHQFEVLKQTTAPLFEAMPIGETHDFSCSMTSYLVEQLTFTQASFDQMQVKRTSQHLSRHGPDCLALQYFPAGGLKGALASGKPLELASDVILLQDLAHPFEAMGQSGRCFSVIIPRSAIALHNQLYQHYPTLSWPVNSPAGRVLAQSWLTLWENLPNTALWEAPAIAQGFIGLLNGLLNGLLGPSSGPSSDLSSGPATGLSSGLSGPSSGHLPGGLRPTQRNRGAPIATATKDAMKAYLQDNLHLPNLTAYKLCQAFHCSRSTVYRLLKSEGGVHAYVRSQRLARCYQALRQLPPSSHKTIGDIASQWGFTDAASFSRLFRKQYGLSPSEVEADSVPLLSSSPDKQAGYWKDSDRLRQWFEGYRST